MFRKWSKWQLILTLAIIAKLLVMVLVTPWGDLINWSAGASNVLGYLSVGRYPPISVTGVYGPLEVMLAPFFWVWTKLPINHPPLTSLPLTNSTPPFSLSILMNLHPCPSNCAWHEEKVVQLWDMCRDSGHSSDISTPCIPVPVCPIQGKIVARIRLVTVRFSSAVGMRDHRHVQVWSWNIVDDCQSTSRRILAVGLSRS